MDTLLEVFLAVGGILVLTAVVVATVGVLSYWVGRYTAFRQTDNLFAPDRKGWIKEWATRIALQHGTFQLYHIREAIDEVVAELEAKSEDRTKLNNYDHEK